MLRGPASAELQAELRAGQAVSTGWLRGELCRGRRCRGWHRSVRRKTSKWELAVLGSLARWLLGPGPFVWTGGAAHVHYQVVLLLITIHFSESSRSLFGSLECLWSCGKQVKAHTPKKETKNLTSQ